MATEALEEKKPEEEAAPESAEKKEPVTPSSDRPTRERKVVERYSAPSVARSSYGKPLSIESPYCLHLAVFIWYLTLKFLLDDREGFKSYGLAFKLSKRKPDDNLQLLHMIFFGKKAKEKQKTKVKEKLVDFCDLLNIPITKATVRKEAPAKLLEFLESPHAITDILLAEKEQKGKKRRGTPRKSMSPGEAADTSAKVCRLWFDSIFICSIFFVFYCASIIVD
ncbi:hypothetical protein COLO4_16650 [Corchorus olitorius]|uniref:Uncharacterized protein n=1 Tax=Corchorus olitorius TaxID=93759 RepID=A0A1R3JG62_9ROSI|nr:hypothetical protein COLO4_16650 [Corchorus olitorius]